jgi:DNA topoisomerase-1
MEEDLDGIARGKEKWVPMLRAFYEPFAKTLLIKYKEIDKMVIETKEICEKCSKPMVIRMGRYGKFLACSGFPECKNTKPLATGAQGEERVAGSEEPSREKCDKCGAEMVIKKGRYGAFLACSAYPECKNIKNIKKTTGLKCPQCKKGEIVERRTRSGKKFWGCELYPKCDYATWEKPKKG